VGFYAEYGAEHILAVTYNSSLDVSNATLWKEGGFEEDRSIECLYYRWEVTGIDGSNITVDIIVNATPWMNASFSAVIEIETGRTWIHGVDMGYSRLWLPTGDTPPSPLTSNPAIDFGEVISTDKGFYYTIQGLQECTGFMAKESDYRPPNIGSRDPYVTSLTFDSDTGMLLSCGAFFILPLPAEARLITFFGGVQLADTNGDLGPPVPESPSLAGLLPLIFMVGLIVALTALFYYASTKKSRRAKRVRRRKFKKR